MSTRSSEGQIYEGTGAELAEQLDTSNRIMLLPDSPMVQREPAQTEHIRIMWGQRLIDDLVSGRYRALVCAVNSRDNSRGIINMLAQSLPTSQWNEEMMTDFARRAARPHAVTVVKYDMDRVMVLGLLRPSEDEHLTLTHLTSGFSMISAMLSARPDRLPVASVSFLGARANKLTDGQGREPSFESVLRVMYDAGYRGDVYPSLAMWASSPAGVFPRYPFPESFKQMREGGY